MDELFKKQQEGFERDLSFLVFNLRQSIKHEREGTNINGHEKDTEKYMGDLEGLISNLSQCQEEIRKFVVERIEKAKKEKFQPRVDENGIGYSYFMYDQYNQALSDLLKIFNKEIMHPGAGAGMYMG